MARADSIMNVIVAKSAGFCWGVKRAVEKARRLAGASTGPVYSDGALIHNEEMLAELKAEGILETKDPSSLRDVTLVVRAHGISPERRAWLKQLPVSLADATCPDVARTQGLIRKHAARGYHTIIFGDPGHAEVVGLQGYAAERGHVVSHVAEVAKLPDMDSVCLVAQSTQLPDDYREIADAVIRRFPGALVFDTICEATKNRQAELMAIASQVEAIVVVGGKHSANTVRLVELARKLKPTFHVQTSSQLDESQLRQFKSVGLTAGASTPDFIIEAMKESLERL